MLRSGVRNWKSGPKTITLFALSPHGQSGNRFGAGRFLWGPEQRNPPGPGGPGGFWLKSGNTYSRTFGTTIGSKSLTTVFGMGTGVAFQILSPESGRRRLSAGSGQKFSVVSSLKTAGAARVHRQPGTDN